MTALLNQGQAELATTAETLDIVRSGDTRHRSAGKSATDAPVVPRKYIELQRKWKRYEITWTLVHYALGISGAVLAFLIGTEKLPAFLEGQQTLIAILAGICVTVLTFTSPASRRKAYSEACDLLRIERLRFEVPDNVEEELVSVLEKGQAIIAKR